MKKGLKYYRDLTNVVNTSREEGREEGILNVAKNMKRGGAFNRSDHETHWLIERRP